MNKNLKIIVVVLAGLSIVNNFIYPFQTDKPSFYDPHVTSTNSLNNTENALVTLAARSQTTLDEDTQTEQNTVHQAVQGTSTEPTVQDAEAQIEGTLNEAKKTPISKLLQWIGLALLILGGLFVLYRLKKMR